MTRLTYEEGFLGSLACRVHDEAQLTLVTSADIAGRRTLAASRAFLIASLLSASAGTASFALARNADHITTFKVRTSERVLGPWQWFLVGNN